MFKVTELPLENGSECVLTRMGIYIRIHFDLNLWILETHHNKFGLYNNSEIAKYFKNSNVKYKIPCDYFLPVVTSGVSDNPMVCLFVSESS